MGRPRHANGQRTRQAILDAALQLFADKGYFGTSLRDIATAVGIRESALYNYFKGKEALFEALIFSDRQRREQSIAAVLESPIRDVRATLTELAVLALEDFASPSQQQLFCILMSDGIRLARAGRLNLFDRMSSGQSRLHALMGQLVRDGQLRDEDPRVLTMEFIGPLVLWRHLHTIEPKAPIIQDPRAFANRHVEQFLLGAARPAKSRSSASGGKRRSVARSVRSRRTSTIH